MKYRWLYLVWPGLILLPFYFTLTVILSGSMQPTLPLGGLAFVRRGVMPQPGDILYAKLPKSYGEGQITHRVVSWRISDAGELLYQTKGDGQANGDAWETPSQDVQGVVVGSVSGIGSFTLRIQRLLQRTLLLK